MPRNGPVMLVILDGWGFSEREDDNAVRLANTPVFDRLWASCPHAFLRTSGLDVGLPDGQMGNSEVGHLNIGAGRVVFQDLPRINQAIAENRLEHYLAATSLIGKTSGAGSTCHLIGLVSDGGVHSSGHHALALANILVAHGFKVIVHVFTDGRDTPPRSAMEQVGAFEDALPAGATIGTVCGRYFAMDRDQRWDRVKQAFEMLVSGKGRHYASAKEAIAASYASDIGDEFIPPSVIGDYTGLRSGDSLLSFNFRADRVRQLLRALLDPAFDAFERGQPPHLDQAVAMTHYSTDLSERMSILFPPEQLSDGLGETLAKAGLTQLRMAETEKFPHVTYFLNGGREATYDGESRILVPSPKVPTYDLQPEMSAPELTSKAVEAIKSKDYALIVLNFANPDMVGHTGVLSAAIKAVETVDAGLGRIVDAIVAVGGSVLVTADHGNCEVMRDPQSGQPHTAHTTNPVPVLFAGRPGYRLRDGRLTDVAPTLLQLLGIAQPVAMTGRSLLVADPSAG